MDKKNKLLISVGGVAILALVVFAVAQTQSKSTQTSSLPGNSSGTPTVPPTDNPTATTSRQLRYKNGTYSVTGTYDSPAGKENLGVTLVLNDGIITDSTVTPMSANRTSDRYQKRFIDSYKTLVVGKSIDSLQLDTVSGSSLTPMGFNDAVAQIKAQAQM